MLRWWQKRSICPLGEIELILASPFLLRASPLRPPRIRFGSHVRLQALAVVAAKRGLRCIHCFRVDDQVDPDERPAAAKVGMGGGWAGVLLVSNHCIGGFDGWVA